MTNLKRLILVSCTKHLTHQKLTFTRITKSQTPLNYLGGKFLLTHLDNLSGELLNYSSTLIWLAMLQYMLLQVKQDQKKVQGIGTQ